MVVRLSDINSLNQHPFSTSSFTSLQSFYRNKERQSLEMNNFPTQNDQTSLNSPNQNPNEKSSPNFPNQNSNDQMSLN